MNLRLVGLDRRARFLGLELETSGRVNPGLAFVAEARCQAHHENGGILMSHSWNHISKRHKFVAWGAHDAQLLREEYERALTTLAERIVRDLFPPERTW